MQSSGRLISSLTVVAIAVVVVGALAPRAHADDTRPTVAVLYFDYSGKDADLGVLRKGLAQMLISDLSALDGVRLVERDRLEEILAELKLSQSGKIDQQTAAKVGKLLGARYMVLGSYFDLMKTLRTDARVVEVESGKIVESTGVTGKPEDFLSVESKLSSELTRILSTKTSVPIKPEKVKATPPAQLKTKTAVHYAKALDAIDHKDKTAAKKELQAAVKEQPDFRLAALEMDRLMQ
jgi:TolB-like protein